MTLFEGEIIRSFPRPADEVFPWLLWVEAFPRWFVLCQRAELAEGEAESEGSVYRVKVTLGGVINKTTLMAIRDLDEEKRHFRFVRAEDGNRVEFAFGVVPADEGSVMTFGALYEGAGRILGVPVGGGLFTRMIERAVDRSLPRLKAIMEAEGS